jgi:hypothetical protein
MPESETTPDHDLPLLLSFKRVCDELGGVSERHVHELVKRGLLEKVYLGRSVKITSRSVKKLAKAK